MNLIPANDNAIRAVAAAPSVTKFVVGRTYSCRSLCDWDCIFRFEIVRRTDKTVTIKYHGKETRRTVRVVDGVESIDPHGRYSMSPVLRADRNE